MKINYEPVRVINRFTIWALSVHLKAVVTQVEAKRSMASMEEKTLAQDCQRILNKLQLDEVRDHDRD